MLDGQDVQTGESELIEGQQQQQPDQQLPVIEVDPDQAELAAAKAALEKEGSEPAAGDQQQLEGQQQQPQPQGQQPRPQDQGGKPKPIMIPKERLDQSLKLQDQLRSAAFYWKGRAEAGGGGQQPAAQQPQPQPVAKTPEEQVADLRAKKKEVVRKFDAGSITAEELEDQRDQIEDQIHAIRNKPAVQPQQSDSLYLDTLSAQLEDQHPYLLEIQDDDHWRFLTVEATKSLAQKGQPLPKGHLNDHDKMRLRTEVAVLSDTFGPTLTGKTIQLPGKPPAQGAQPSGAPAGAKPSATATARLTKLQAAAAAPPNLNGLGNPGPLEGEVSESSIEQLDEESILALPKATRDRMMGRAPSQR
jgi:hypothetical protein